MRIIEKQIKYVTEKIRKDIECEYNTILIIMTNVRILDEIFAKFTHSQYPI